VTEGYIPYLLFAGLLLGYFWWRKRARATAQAERPKPQAAEPEPVPESLEVLLERIASLADSGMAEGLLAQRDFCEAVERIVGGELDRGEFLPLIDGPNLGKFALVCESIRRLSPGSEEAGKLLEWLPNLNERGLFFCLRALGTASFPVLARALALAPRLTTPPAQVALGQFIEERNAASDSALAPLLETRPADDASRLRAFLKACVPQAAAGQIAEIDTHLDCLTLRQIGRIWTRESLAADGAPMEEERSGAASQSIANTILTPPRRPVLLIGESGVGKTALIQRAALRLIEQGWLVFEAGAADLIAGQETIGSLEERVKTLLEVLAHQPRTVWVIPDLQNFPLAGTHQHSEIGLLDMLFRSLERGAIRVLCEVRPAAYDRLRRTNPRIGSVFAVFHVDPLPASETLDLARRWAAPRSTVGGCLMADPLLSETYLLARQYQGERASPGNLLDLLRLTERAVEAAHGGPAAIERSDVLAALAQLTGLPMTILDERQSMDLDGLRRYFEARVLGQPEAVECLVERVAMIKAGLTDPTRPQGVFFFAGPTGTGKTEIAKTLAGYLFGAPERMIRLDMSEFQSLDSLDRIYGQAGAPVGMSLLDQVRAQPFSVILLDEFEKAHPAVWDLFLQVFDDGRLTDSAGNTANFRHAIIILTSNLGAGDGGGNLGFATTEAAPASSQIHKAIGRTFRPEFINRLDRIVVFRPLSRAVMRELLSKELREVLQLRGLRQQTWAVEFEDSAIDFLLEKGFSPDMGARPLKRAIDRFLLSPLAVTIVNRQAPQGDQFLFVRSNGKAIQVTFVDPDTPPPLGEAAGGTGTGTLEGAALTGVSTPEVLRLLEAEYRDLGQVLAGGEWAARKQGLLDQMNRAGFWDSPGRFAALGNAEYLDRIEEAVDRGASLLRRLTPSGKRPRRGDDVLRSVALRAILLRAALRDVYEERPHDALILVEARGHSAATAERIVEMYAAWAAQRGGRLESARLPGPDFRWLGSVSGFAGYSLLEDETGLHIWEFPEDQKPSRRGVRVRVRPHPPALLDLDTSTDRDMALREFPPVSDDELGIVRTYREEPSPLVKDRVRNWRTGLLNRVLAGDFDLIR